MRCRPDNSCSHSVTAMTDNTPVTPSPQSSPDGHRGTTSRETQDEQGYTEHETKALLRIMERVLPLGLSLWRKVADDYNEMFPEYPRTLTSLSDQYKKMLYLEPPDPTALRVMKKIMRNIPGPFNSPADASADAPDNALADAPSAGVP
jgi:hypothetical protein